MQEHDRWAVAGDLAVENEVAPVLQAAYYLEGFRLHASYTVTRSFPLTGEKHGSMALRDTWHRTLVYFGLAEEEDPRYEPVREPEPEVELEDRYRDRPNVRRLQRRRRDEIDDIFADEPRGPARETRPLRPVGGNGRGGDIQVHLVIPKSFNDAQQIADQFKDAIPVILNLQSTDTDLAKRLIDFASGLTYALDGGMQRIADKVFLLTPRNVEVSAEERARLIEKGFFNQS
jgi:cell division inhibitor SepF